MSDFDPYSYSFKLSDRAGTNIYSPYGDGPESSGWRTFSNSHNTMAPNASLHLSWKGTAITINGYVNSSQGPPAYLLSLDGQPPTQEILDEGRNKAGVLLSKTGLPLAYHTIVLSNIAGGNLTVEELLLTIPTGAPRSAFFFLAVSLYKPAADTSWQLAMALDQNLNRRNHWFRFGLYCQYFLYLQWKLVSWGYAIPRVFTSSLTGVC